MSRSLGLVMVECDTLFDRFEKELELLRDRRLRRRSSITYPWHLLHLTDNNTRNELLRQIMVFQITLHLLISMIELEIAVREQFPINMIEQLEAERELFRDAATIIARKEEEIVQEIPQSRSFQSAPQDSGTYFLIKAAYLPSRRATSNEDMAGGYGPDEEDPARDLNFEAEFRRSRAGLTSEQEMHSRPRQIHEGQVQGRPSDRQRLEYQGRRRRSRTYSRSQRSDRESSDKESQDHVHYELEIAELREQVARLLDEREDLRDEHDEEVEKLRRRLKRSAKKTIRLEDEIDRLHARLDDAEDLSSDVLDD